jgi:hypothetical protein
MVADGAARCVVFINAKKSGCWLIFIHLMCYAACLYGTPGEQSCALHLRVVERQK